MPEPARLIQPSGPDDPSLQAQVMALCLQAVQAAGGYLVPHPEEHSVIVVFGGHQVAITVEPHDL